MNLSYIVNKLLSVTLTGKNRVEEVIADLEIRDTSSVTINVDLSKTDTIAFKFINSLGVELTIKGMLPDGNFNQALYNVYHLKGDGNANEQAFKDIIIPEFNFRYYLIDEGTIGWESLNSSPCDKIQLRITASKAPTSGKLKVIALRNVKGVS